MSEKEWLEKEATVSDSNGSRTDDEIATPDQHAHATEKETAASGKPSAKPARRESAMSVEQVSSSGDSILTESDHEEYERDYNEKRLRPHISHTSSTGAVGGIVPTLARTSTQKTNGTTGTARDYAFEVDFDEIDKADPRQWSLWYKGLILFIMSLGTTCVVLYSTSYTSAIPGMQEEFGISDTLGVVGVTTYMIGIACGAIILAPLSEMYGRRPIYIVALGVFLLFVIPCAVAKDITTILVSRFFGAFCAAALISNSPGTVSDIVDDEHRALFFSIWSIGPMNG